MLGDVKVLLDANILIAIEGDAQREHINSHDAKRLHRLIGQAGGVPCILDNVRDDFLRVAEESLRQRRLRELEKYAVLGRVNVDRRFAERAGYNFPFSPNDKVDAAQLLALERNAVSWFVTEDRGIHSKAAVLGVSDRVLFISDALVSLGALVFEPIEHYSVMSAEPHQLDLSAPIFDSLRLGYPGFNSWWTGKVVQEGRPCLVLGTPDQPIGISVLNEDKPDIGNLPGKVLKICTFKIDDDALGFKRGELLLGTTIEYAREHFFDSCFVEVQDVHESLVALLTNFGFFTIGEKRQGELVWGKILNPSLDPAPPSDPLEYNVRFGPGAMLVERAYLVPIVPRWHDALFPGAATQAPLFEQSYGNAVRKVYICNSSIKKLRPGDSLFFLRTRNARGIHAIGVLEETMRSRSTEEIVSFSGSRTVFSRRELEEICRKETLAIKFRLNGILERPVGLTELRELGVMPRSPQSIAEMKTWRALRWAKETAEG